MSESSATSTQFADDAAADYASTVKGIENRGNTCYISAVLQLLAAAQIGLDASTEEDHPIANAVLRTLDSLQASGGPINIEDLWQSIGSTMPQFYNDQQQDAHEFLLALFQSPMPPKALDDFKWQSKVTNSIPETGYYNTILEHNVCMQLCINRSTPKLEQCIAAAHHEEQLSEEDSLQCPLTALFKTTFRATSIESLPLKLIIQLKRFSLHGKDNTSACIPRTLTIHSDTQGGVKFRIAAAIIHHGSLHQGHYTALVFSPRSGAIVYCDDSVTRTVPWATAEQLLKQAYVLAYHQL